MICPKCKKQIQEKSLKCPHCNATIATLCKKCKTYNSIYNLNCTGCDSELLKVCPKCKSINLTTAHKCRKCDFLLNADAPMAKLEQKAEIRLNYDANFYTQQVAKDEIINGIKSTDKKIISLSGQKGVGKSSVLKAAINELKDENITWLLGECSSISQLSPCGLIQDLLLTFFNVTNFCTDGLKLKKESQRFFQSEFPTLTNEEIFNLLNFLYPNNSDYYENMSVNKSKTFTFLEKVFKTITENHKTVLIIDNFDSIDGMSYEFLQTILSKYYDGNIFKLILTYNELRPARGYIYSNEIKGSEYLDISLKTFEKNQSAKFIEQYLPDEQKYPSKTKQEIVEYSSGIPAIIEQYVNYVIDFTEINNSYNIDVPPSFQGLIQNRLELLKKSNATAYKILAMASICGSKFYPSLINKILELPEQEFMESLESLQKKNFIMPVSEYAFSFKNSILLEAISIYQKDCEEFTEFNRALFSLFSSMILSTNSIKAILAQNINNQIEAFSAWTQNIKIASFIGDINLYAISQKQALLIVEKANIINATLIKNNIYERLGKLLSLHSPTEALKYLPHAIEVAKTSENIFKEIELTGYLANCCINLGDYHGTVECVDSVISKLDDSFELELAMLKSRKLKALLNIGNSGQIINLCDNEIMPIFEKHLSSRGHKNISIKTLYSAWLQTYLILAYALIFQGNNRSFEVISTLFELFNKNGFEDNLFICKTKLALALANTIKGDVEESEKILEDIIKVYKTDIMDDDAISKWNLTNIINNFLHKKYNGLQEELFQVVTFANNTNDHFTKNILRTLLGKMFKDQENAKHALDIYYDQITYFAKEKNAIGALLTWYLIAQAELIVEGPDKTLEVSSKALDVAQSPKINNYMFIAMFNRLIAEAYMAKSDYESAKVHLEKAIMVAKKFEMLDLLSKLYLLYGKYLQDIALVKSDSQYDYVTGAAKMYKKAGLISKSLNNSYITEKVEKSKTVLNSFCQLNGIVLKDTN